MVFIPIILSSASRHSIEEERRDAGGHDSAERQGYFRKPSSFRRSL
jgi:hypothetical protein